MSVREGGDTTWLRQHGGVRRISCESGNSSQLTVGRTDRRVDGRTAPTKSGEGEGRCSDSATINIPLRSRNLSALKERERGERDLARASHTDSLPPSFSTRHPQR